MQRAKAPAEVTAGSGQKSKRFLTDIAESIAAFGTSNYCVVHAYSISTCLNSVNRKSADLEADKSMMQMQTTSKNQLLRSNESTPNDPKLRVAFVFSDYIDPTRIDSWSGLPYFISHALEKQGVELTFFSLASNRGKYWRLIKFATSKILLRKRYLRDRDPVLLRSYAKQIESALQGKDFDFLFCPGTNEIAYVRTELPIAFWGDASFDGMLNFYDSFSRLLKSSIREGKQAESSALERSALALYSSEWAANSAKANYTGTSREFHVIRFGANLDDAPSTSDIHDVIDSRDRSSCRLLLIGVDWKRKGVDVALDALASLTSMGVNANLTIIGCQAPPNTRLPSNVQVLGYVNKGTPEGKELIERHLRESHLFFMPSRAEAYGLAFCEASAFGLPCIATDVGGVSSIIENGVNGWLLPLDASPEDYAKRILELYCNQEVYREAARNGRRIFDQYLNWDVAAAQVVALMRKHLNRKT